jgi:hypothetical protein
LGIGNLDTSAPVFARVSQDTCLKVHSGNDSVAVDELLAGTTAVATGTLTSAINASAPVFTWTFYERRESETVNVVELRWVESIMTR